MVLETINVSLGYTLSRIKVKLMNEFRVGIFSDRKQYEYQLLVKAKASQKLV